MAADDGALVAESARRMLPAEVDPAIVERAVRMAPDVTSRASRRPALDGTFVHDIDAALPGAGAVLGCADRIAPGYPLEVLLGAHHLVVADAPSTRLVVMRREVPEGVQLVEHLIVTLHLDTVWRTPPLTGAQRNRVVDRCALLLALGDSPSSWLAVRDAMALGTPVIARDVGALALLVDDAALLLRHDIGPRDLAVAIERVLSDAALRAALTARGRARSERTHALDAVPGVLVAINRELALEREP